MVGGGPSGGCAGLRVVTQGLAAEIAQPGLAAAQPGVDGQRGLDAAQRAGIIAGLLLPLGELLQGLPVARFQPQHLLQVARGGGGVAGGVMGEGAAEPGLGGLGGEGDGGVEILQRRIGQVAGQVALAAADQQGDGGGGAGGEELADALFDDMRAGLIGGSAQGLKGAVEFGLGRAGGAGVGWASAGWARSRRRSNSRMATGWRAWPLPRKAYRASRSPARATISRNFATSTRI